MHNSRAKCRIFEMIWPEIQSRIGRRLHIIKKRFRWIIAAYPSIFPQPPRQTPLSSNQPSAPCNHYQVPRGLIQASRLRNSGLQTINNPYVLVPYVSLQTPVTIPAPFAKSKSLIDAAHPPSQPYKFLQVTYYIPQSYIVNTQPIGTKPTVHRSGLPVFGLHIRLTPSVHYKRPFPHSWRRSTYVLPLPY